MSALKKKIAAKKAEEDAAKAPAPPPPPPPPKAKAEDPNALKSGFLGNAELYPEGSAEGSSKGWRKGSANSVALDLESTADAYTITGEFREAGRYVGKEDFKVERLGLALRVRGSDDDRESAENGAAESLVSGLDQTINLPPDASNDGMTADYTDCKLVITIPRLRDGPLAELVAGLSLSEALAVGSALERGAAAAPSPEE